MYVETNDLASKVSLALWAFCLRLCLVKEIYRSRFLKIYFTTVQTIIMQFLFGISCRCMSPLLLSVILAQFIIGSLLS